MDKIIGTRTTPHYGQLIVPKWQLKTEASNTGVNFAYDLLYCISNGTDDPEYKLRLLHMSEDVHTLSRLVYKTKGGFAKLPVKKYEECLFLNYMESKEEVRDRLASVCRIPADADSDAAFRCVEALKPMILRWVSCLTEQMFVSEYAFLIDYVIRRKGDVPYPDDGLFPKNYVDFNYNEGIGKEFSEYGFGIM